jgi:hypothetical protein
MRCPSDSEGVLRSLYGDIDKIVETKEKNRSPHAVEAFAKKFMSNPTHFEQPRQDTWTPPLPDLTDFKFSKWVCSQTKRLISIIHHIAQKNGIWYTTMRGTALAAIRHKGGCFNDIDGDIQVKTKEDAKALERLSIQSGHHVISDTNKIQNFGDAERDDTFYSKGLSILIFRIFPCTENSFPYIDVWTSYKKVKIEQRVPCKMGNVSTFCPKNPNVYLEKVYGNDWKTPILNQYTSHLKSGEHIKGCMKTNSKI